MAQQFEWDEGKNRNNRRKHGISFAEAAQIFEGAVLTAPGERADYGETRLISYGLIQDIVVTAVVHTDRAGVTRIISARRASRKERQAYYDHLKKTAHGNRSHPG